MYIVCMSSYQTTQPYITLQCDAYIPPTPLLLFFQLRPLSELVKEVQCAGVKKLYLRRAIDQYLSESDSCHCQPCSNNGMAVMDGDECKCICKPGTSGQACEQGMEADGQQGTYYISDRFIQTL